MTDAVMNSWNVDIENSWLIGDKDPDIQFALNGGIQNTIQIKSGQQFDIENSKAKYILNLL